MSALNKKGAIAQPKFDAVSYNGNPQFSKDDAQQLYEIIIMTLYGKDSFYESGDTRIERLETLVNSVVSQGKLDFIANAILHARHVMNIRTMPLVLTVYFAKALRDRTKPIVDEINDIEGKTKANYTDVQKDRLKILRAQREKLQYPHLRHLVRDVIGRADQITDMYAAALQVFGTKNAIPLAVKRGVADAFNKFNEYQFAKNSSKASVKLRDVLRIVHPKGNTEAQGEIFKRIMAETLATPYTWETELSANGQAEKGEQKTKDVLWTELMASGKVGYMALLRNLRNILEAGVPSETIELVASRIADPKAVAKSKQLPFRFINALDSIESFANAKLNRALSRAVDASLGNLPKIGDRVWIIVDCSSSMNGHSGSYSHILQRGGKQAAGPVPMKVASMFAAALAKASGEALETRVTMFSDRAMHVPYNSDDSVMTITKSFMSKVFGGGTQLESAISMKKDLGFEPDTVIVLSDMQVDSLTTKKVSSLFAKDCVKIAINIEAYGSTPLNTDSGWMQLGGWSDRVFTFIPALRQKQTVVDVLDKPYVGMEGIRNIVKTEEDDVE